MALKPEKVIRDGKVAVLISPDYGAGWSTWVSDDNHRETMLFDRRFVEAAEAGVEDIEPLAKAIFGERAPYLGGWDDITVEWLPVGTRFAVNEYDGLESIEIADVRVYTA